MKIYFILAMLISNTCIADCFLSNVCDQDGEKCHYEMMCENITSLVPLNYELNGDCDFETVDGASDYVCR